jgi:hypothetical protein
LWREIIVPAAALRQASLIIEQRSKSKRVFCPENIIAATFSGTPACIILKELKLPAASRRESTILKVVRLS